MTTTLKDTGFELLPAAEAIDLAGLRTMFENIPPDPYSAKGCRFKLMTRCRVDGSEVVEQPHGPLYQPDDTIPLYGGRVREYEKIRDLSPANEAIKIYARRFGLDAGSEILVQAQRTTCKKDEPGEPALEGFHRDNIQYLAILCVSRDHVGGGITKLAKTADGQDVALVHTLLPGEMLLVEDAEWFHYTSPIFAEGVDETSRDVLLISSTPGHVNRPRPRR